MNLRKMYLVTFCTSYISFLFIQSYAFGQTGTYSRKFRYYAPEATSISVVGDFNQWNSEKGLMTKTKSGYWEKQVTMQRGFQRYAFLRDGILVRDPNNNDFVRNSSKQWVSFLFIPPNDEIVFPDELENDLRNIQFKLYNAPPFYFYRKFPEKVMEFKNETKLYVDLNVTKEFTNVMFEFTINKAHH